MKRKALVLISAVMLVVGIVTTNALANSGSYNTTGRQYIGSVYNNTTSTKTAYGKLYPAGGIAELQICNAAGTTIYKTGTYPLNPVNPNETTFACPAYTTRSFYVKAISGQAWGDIIYGLR